MTALLDKDQGIILLAMYIYKSFVIHKAEETHFVFQ